MAQIKKQSQPSSPHCPPPHPHIKPLGTLPTARLEGRLEGGSWFLLLWSWLWDLSTLSCKHGQGPTCPQSQGKLLSVGCKPTSFAAREEYHQVRVGVCVVGAGAGRAPGHILSKDSKSKICLGTRDWQKTSEFNLKHLEKKERNAFVCVRDRPHAHFCPALSYSGWVTLAQGSHLEAGPWGCSSSPQVRSPGRPVLLSQALPRRRSYCTTFPGASEARWSVEMNGTYSLGEKTVLIRFLGANACWVLV